MTCTQNDVHPTPQHAVMPEPPTSSLPHVLDPESDLAHAASATITRLLATVVTDPDFESTAAFALVTELVDIAARIPQRYYELHSLHFSTAFLQGSLHEEI
ncbi:unnamed protein product [Closterium sp. NIES-53]